MKTAIHGGDPNWGRLLAVAGRAGVAFDADRAKVTIGPTVLFADGRPYDDRAPEEMYSRVDVEKLPGQVIWQRELKPTAGVDKPETLPLSWDEILGEHKTGTVLLTAESIVVGSVTSQ